MEWYHIWTKKLVIFGFFIALAVIIGSKVKEIIDRRKNGIRKL